MGFKIAIFSLNQWALDFTGNTRRIIKSIDLAHSAGAAYRAGPELELCGYSLEDAFYEQDTVYHSWSCLLDIINHSAGMNMIIDIGMPVYHSALFNCRVIIHMGKILCIRAKTKLAREGNYREFRHFTPWNYDSGITAYRLPSFISEKLRQKFVPLGANFILELKGHENQCDTLRIGWEICQELWEIKNVSSDLYSNFGCHLVINGSASYWELRKLNTVLDMIKGISLRGGACYAFSNPVGCDGQRYVMYGRSCIYDKGKLVAMTATDSKILEEVQMICHTVEPKAINEYRAQMGISSNLAKSIGFTWALFEAGTVPSQINSNYNKLYLDYQLPSSELVPSNDLLASNISIRFEQEIHLYVSLWMWDYLRRSQMIGFMMPLSGGLDSSSVAILVYSMCKLLHSNLSNNIEIQNYFQKVHKISPAELTTKLPSAKEICKRILKCCYLSTRYSSEATLRRAKLLSESIGADFIDMSLQDVYSNFRNLLAIDGSDDTVTVLDQNLQARLRMTATYYLSGGNRIVLATGNVDEGIMGYLTKYDCSSADINPIGGMCKEDLSSYLRYCCQELYKSERKLVDIIEDIISAPPSAELTGAEQRDEDEIGITYDEIAVLGRVRRGEFACSGPRGAFETVWQNRYRLPFCSKIRCLSSAGRKTNLGEMAEELAVLIKRFYERYAKNRHKLTVLTPALHTETYSPDDNRFDHRHFLYAPWTEQFKSIDSMVNEIKKSNI